MRGIALIDGVERQLEASGDTQFVEDPEQVVADGVFAEMKLAGNIAIGAALGDELNEAELAIGEESGSPGIGNYGRGALGNGFDQETELLTVGPNLAFMNFLDAFGEHVERIVAGEDAASAGAKRLNNESALGGLQEHDDGNGPTDIAKFARDPKSGSRTILQGAANDTDIGVGELESLGELGRFDDRGGDSNVAAATKRRFHEITSHSGMLGNQERYRVSVLDGFLHSSHLKSDGVQAGQRLGVLRAGVASGELGGAMAYRFEE